jgi:hypothetical protein
MVVAETIRRVRASGGKSHSKVTPTTSAPAPMAKRISVVEGNNDAMRTNRRLRRRWISINTSLTRREGFGPRVEAQPAEIREE